MLKSIFNLFIEYSFCLEGEKKMDHENERYTMVTRNYRVERNPIPLPFYPHAVGHYLMKKNARTVEKKFMTPHFSLQWICDGILEYTLDGREFLLRTNDVIFAWPGEERIRHVLSDRCDLRWMTFDGQLAPAHLMAYGYDRYLPNAGPCPVDLFQKISENISDSDPFMQRMIVSWYDQIFAYAGGRHDPTVHSGMFAKRVLEIIETQYSNPEINVNTICGMLGCSRATLNRLFREATGRTPGEYLESHRIVEAGALLRGSDLSVSDISKRCGFQSLNTFCRFFKRISGMSPKVFREKRGVD